MEIVKGEGIVLNISETHAVPVVNGGGSIYWDADFQGMLRTNQYGGDWARFFPKAEMMEGATKVRFSYIECNNAKEAMSRSRGINEGGEGKAGIRRSELEAFFKAIEDIHRLENTATEPDKKAFISTLRLPDPTESPEKYRIYIGNDGKEHLAVLWGYERLAEHDCCNTHPLDEFKRKFVKYVLPDTVDKLKMIHKIILGVTALLVAILLIVLIAKAFSRKDNPTLEPESQPIQNITNGSNSSNGNIGLGTPTPVGDNNGTATATSNAPNGNNADNGNSSGANANNGNSLQSTPSGTQQSGVNASSGKENSAKAELNGIVATDGSESAAQNQTAAETNSSTTNTKDKNTSESSMKKSDEKKDKSIAKDSNVATSKVQGKDESTAKKSDKNIEKDKETTATVAPVKIAKTENETMLGSRNDVRLKISEMALQKKKVQVTLMLEAISSVKDSKISEITMDGRKPEKLSGGKAIFLLDLNHRYKVQGRIEYDKNGQKFTNSIDDFLLLNLGATLDSAKE